MSAHFRATALELFELVGEMIGYGRAGVAMIDKMRSKQARMEQRLRTTRHAGGIARLSDVVQANTAAIATGFAAQKTCIEALDIAARTLSAASEPDRPQLADARRMRDAVQEALVIVLDADAQREVVAQQGLAKIMESWKDTLK